MILAQGTVCRSDTAIQAQPSPMDISSPSCARGSQQDRRRCTLPCTTRTDRSALSKTLPAWPTLPRREGMNFEGQAGCTGGVTRRPSTNPWAFRAACRQHTASTGQRCDHVCDGTLFWHEAPEAARLSGLESCTVPVSAWQESGTRNRALGMRIPSRTASASEGKLISEASAKLSTGKRSK